MRPRQIKITATAALMMFFSFCERNLGRYFICIQLGSLLVESLNTKRLPSWKQIKYLPRFLSQKEKNIMRAAVAVIFICLGLMTYAFLKDNLVEKPAHGGAYAENVVGFPQ